METSSTRSDAPPPQSDLSKLVRYAERIQNWTTGKLFSDYRADTLISDAVERNFIEVGQIIHRLEASAPELYHQIPQAESWHGFRIILVHFRWRIDQTIVWDTIQIDLSVLIQAAGGLLQQNRPSRGLPHPKRVSKIAGNADQCHRDLNLPGQIHRKQSAETFALPARQRSWL